MLIIISRIAVIETSFKYTAEAQRAQRKPNEDTLTGKHYRNKFDGRI